MASRQQRISRCLAGDARRGRLLRVEALEDRRLLAIDLQLVGDFNVQPASGLFPVLPSFGTALTNNMTPVGGQVFFTVSDFEHGTELWKSDGTEAGTMLVKDILPGPSSSVPKHLKVAGGTLFFQANGPRGYELWKSDGTEAGTVPVRRIDEGGPQSPFELTNVNGTLYFIGEGDTSGRELWKSDGTAAGTVMVKNITTFFSADTFAPEYLQQSNPNYRSYFTAVGSTLFFVATTESSYSIVGRELWKSDGTSGGTGVVKEIRSGIQGAFDFPSFDPALTNVNGTLYFVADDGINGAELWKSNGTAAGTALVKNITAGLGSTFTSTGGRIVGIGDTAYFTINGFSSRIWKSDGTSAGTMSILNSPQFGYSELTVVGNRLYFAALNASGIELWSSDGSEAGTAIVKNIASGSASSSPRWLTNVNGTLYFAANDILHGEELWKSDGTSEGTILVSDIRAGASSQPNSLTVVGDAIFFAANDGSHGVELWSSDGSAAGTALVKDIQTATQSFSPSEAAQLNGILLFAATNGVSGQEVWRTDGTAAGTSLVVDISAGANSLSPRYFKRVGDRVYFIAASNSNRTDLWRTDGTAVGTVRVTEIAPSTSVSPYFTDFAEALYLQGAVGGSGAELLRSDGSEAGTVVVKDIHPGAEGSAPELLTDVAGTLFFYADDGAHGRELWKSDGTEAGTVLVKDIVLGAEGLSLNRATAVGNLLYFSTDDGVHGVQLWRSDGTAEGTWMVTDEPRESFSFGPDNLIDLNGTLYFTDRTYLWKLGPNAVSPTLVKAIHSGPSSLTTVDDVLFFTAGDTTFGRELWKSDGTEAGTVMVKDIVPGSGSIGHFIATAAIAGTFYFSIDDGVHGVELWSSDGTAAGTQLVADLAEGSPSASPSNMAVLGSRLVLGVTTREYGRELWSATLTPSLVGDYDLSGEVNGHDFLAWQRNLGSAVTPHGSGADGDGSGRVDAGDLTVWRDNFGTPAVVVAETAAVFEESAAVAVREDGDDSVQSPRAIDAVFSTGDFTKLFDPSSSERVPGSRRYRPARRL